jgi:hypothetical protein
MGQQSKLAEEKTTYELQRDKHVAELAKKLLPFIATCSSLAIAPVFVIFSVQFEAEFLQWSRSLVVF